MTSNSSTVQNLELDPAQVATALTDAAARVCTLLQCVADPVMRVAATPGWTVAELARHVAFLPDYYRGAPRGEFSWTPDAATMPQVNERNMETLRDLSPAAAASTCAARWLTTPGMSAPPRRLSSLFPHTRAR